MTVDFNKLARDIYEGEINHCHARIVPNDPDLSTYGTADIITEAFDTDYDSISFIWDSWYGHWRDTRATFIERFGQTQPDIEILILEKTLRKYFEK